MNENSNTRSIDSLGRIVIPSYIRKRLNITSKDLLDIYVLNDKVILEKKHQLCNAQIIKLLLLGKKVTGNDYAIIDNGKIIYSTDDSTLEMLNIKNHMLCDNKAQSFNLNNIYYVLRDLYSKKYLVEYSKNSIVSDNMIDFITSIIQNIDFT